MMAPGQSDAGGDGAPAFKTKRVGPPPSLTGIAVVWRAFLFLDGPAEVLRASTANHRWHELATADSVWRVKARREGMVEKAGVFEVALPVVADGAAAAEEEEDKELAGVGLAFYAQVFVLKVGLAWRGVACVGAPSTLTTAAARTRCHPSAGVQDEERGLGGVR